MVSFSIGKIYKYANTYIKDYNINGNNRNACEL